MRNFLTVAFALLLSSVGASAQSGSIAATSTPPSDYRAPEAWLCRPGRADACAVDLSATVVAADGRRQRESFRPDPNAAIDCFYVYPTVSRDTSVHSDMVAGDEERNVIRQQFARFASVCRPYAPLYRQVTLAGLRSLLNATAAGREAETRLDHGPGYEDVRAAWNYYVENDNGGRGVVLVGHSQGAMVLTELVRREIEGRPVQARVVSAVLLGTTVTVPRGQETGGSLRVMPVCRRLAQTGCVMSYASFRDTVPPPEGALFARVPNAEMEAVCVNPAAMGGGRGALRSYFDATGRTITGAPRPWVWDRSGAIETPFVSLPGLLSARCVSGAGASYLEVTVHADTSDPRTDDIPGDVSAAGRVLANWGLHLVDVELAIGNLVDVVRAQGAAYVGAAGSATRAAVPRAADGRPDLNGIWQALGTAHWDLEPHMPRAALAFRPGPVTPIPAREVVALGAVGAVPGGTGAVVGGRIPYTAEALAKRDENRARYLERDPEIRCFLPGVPRATYMPFPFQVFQSTRAFFIAYEYAGAVRNIYLEDPGPPQVDSWMGQSTGRWDGDTFVVESSGFNDQSWFDRAGNHHSEQLKVVERFTMTGPDHIQYEATMEDPRTFTRPWTIRLPLYRLVNPDAKLGQFKCVQFVEELLYGHLRKSLPR
jgi:hypothetical protein